MLKMYSRRVANAREADTVAPLENLVQAPVTIKTRRDNNGAGVGVDVGPKYRLKREKA